jgi:hypothetical protein
VPKVLDDLYLEEIQHGIQGLPTAASTPPPSTLLRAFRHPLPLPVGRNAHQDSSSTKNTLNNNSRRSLTRRRITTTTAMVVVAMTVVVTALAASVVRVAPPPPLPPRVYGLLL